MSWTSLYVGSIWFMVLRHWVAFKSIEIVMVWWFHSTFFFSFLCFNFFRTHFLCNKMSNTHSRERSARVAFKNEIFFFWSLPMLNFSYVKIREPSWLILDTRKSLLTPVQNAIFDFDSSVYWNKQKKYFPSHG